MKGAIVRSMSGVCSNTTTQDLKLDTYPSQTLIHWNKIVAIDATTKPDLIRVGLLRSGEFYTAKSQLPSQIGNSVGVAVEIHAPGDFVPCARFEGADSGDVLELYAFGHIVSEEEPF